jgi:hypothetical protein
LPGTYTVLFVDSISKSNTSVPIVVRPYAAPVTSSPTNPNKARPSGGGSIFAIHNHAELNQINWAVNTLLFVFWFAAYSIITL